MSERFEYKREMTMSYDKSMITDKSEAHEAFGITKERSAWLASALADKLKTLNQSGMLKEGGDWNSLECFTEFLSSEELTGNDIAWLAFVGYMSMMTANQMCAKMLGDPSIALAVLFGRLR